jgi:hypothetical protein
MKTTNINIYNVIKNVIDDVLIKKNLNILKLSNYILFINKYKPIRCIDDSCLMKQNVHIERSNDESYEESLSMDEESGEDNYYDDTYEDEAASEEFD